MTESTISKLLGHGGTVKIFSQTMNQSLNELISDKGVCGTAPATPDPLNIDFCGYRYFYRTGITNRST